MPRAVEVAASVARTGFPPGTRRLGTASYLAQVAAPAACDGGTQGVVEIVSGAWRIALARACAAVPPVMIVALETLPSETIGGMMLGTFSAKTVPSPFASSV